MPTVVIPCGSAEDVIFAATASTEHFFGNASIGVDYTAEINEHTSTTGTTALSTDDEATYVTAFQHAFNADMHATYPAGIDADNDYYLGIKGRQDEAFSLPTGIRDLTVRILVTARSDYAHFLSTRWYAYDTAEVLINAQTPTGAVDATAEWGHHAFPLSSSSPTFEDSLRASLAVRGTTLTVSPFGWGAEGAGLQGDDLIAFLALEVSWSAGRRSVIPPCHLYPRSAIENITVYPPASSRQRSNRTNGYH